MIDNEGVFEFFIIERDKLYANALKEITYRGSIRSSFDARLALSQTLPQVFAHSSLNSSNYSLIYLFSLSIINFLCYNA
jgi:hypothetical protein